MRIAVIVLFWLVLVGILFYTRKTRSVVFWPLLALAALLFFNLLFTSQFYQLEMRAGHLYGVPIDVLNHASKVCILAIGMTLVIATGGIDLSVGATMAIAGAIMAYLSRVSEVPAVYCVLAALGLGLLAGMWNGLLVAIMGIPPMVATLILMTAGRGIAQLITNGQIIIFYDPALIYIGNGFLILPFPFILMLGLFVLTRFTTKTTAVGYLIEAVGDNEVAASRAGVSAKTIKFLVYVFCGFCAAIAGLIHTTNIKSADANNIGLNLELDAIMAVVIGGTAMTGGRFFLASSIISAILIQTLTTTMYAKNVSPVIAPVPKAIVILAVCLLQSERVKRYLASRHEHEHA